MFINKVFNITNSQKLKIELVVEWIIKDKAVMALVEVRECTVLLY